MKNLFLCNTPYQVIVATQIATSKYENNINDIIVTDKIADYESLYENIKKSGVFNKVTIWKIKNKYAKKSGLFFVLSLLLYRFSIQFAESMLQVVGINLRVLFCSFAITV